MKHGKAICFVLILLLSATCLYAAKPRLAVIRFDNNTQWWRGELDELAPNMLVTELVKSGKFSLMERERLNEILKEQNLGVSGRVTPQTAARIGKLLGVQYLVTGTITKFSMEKKKASFIVGSVKKTEAKVTLDVRAFNTSSGEIVFSDRGSSSKTFSKVYVMGAGGGVDFDRGLAEEILEGSIQDLAGKMINSGAFGASAANMFMVAKVSGNKVYINAGKDKGIAVGDVLTVSRKGEEIIDPETGQSLGADMEQVGTIRVLTVKGRLSICETVSGGPFRTKDMVEK